MAVGAPNKRLFDMMQVADVVLMILFFGSLHWAIEGGEGSIIGPPVSLLPTSRARASTAKMHVKLVGLMAVLASLGMLAIWLRLMNVDG